MRPCQDVRKKHLLDNTELPVGVARGFIEVAFLAEDNLRASPALLSCVDESQWNIAAVRGVLMGSDGVSGILGMLEGRYVFWSRGCGRLVDDPLISGGIDPCASCDQFYRLEFVPTVKHIPIPDAPTYTEIDGLFYA